MLLALDSLAGFTGIMLVVFLIVIVLSCAVAGLELFATVTNWIILHKRRKLRKTEVENGHTVEESVRIFLDSNGMSDVKIEEGGFWRTLALGSYYSPKMNVFYIPKRQMKSKNLANVSTTLQRVGKAVNYKEGDKKVKGQIQRQTYIPFLPFLIIPIILMGVLVDGAIFKFEDNFIATLVATVISLVFFVVIAIWMFASIKVEKSANEKALELMSGSNFLTAEEDTKVRSLYKWTIMAYIANFIIALIRIIQLIFKILGLIFKVAGRRR